MFFFTYTAAVLTILFVCAAAFLFFKGRNDTLTRIFTLYILADAVWIGGNAIADISKDDTMLILSSSIAFIGSSFIVTFFLIFVDTFMEGRLPSFKRLTAYTLPTVLLAIFSFSPNAVLGTIYPEGAPAQIVPGGHYYFFLFFLIAGLMYALIRLFFFYKNSEGAKKLQAIYIAIGFMALFFGGVTFGLLLPLFGEFRFYNLAPQFSFIFALASGYAILKHNLLDIRIVIQRGFIYSILFFFIVAVYWGLITISGLFLQQITQMTVLIPAGLTTIIGIFSVPYIDRQLRKKTDRFFFKDRYDYALALYGLSEKVNQTLVVEDIKTLTEAALSEILKARTVTMNLTKENDAAHSDTSSPADKNDGTLTIPITLDDESIGSIFLGPKLSGDTYTQQDIVLIKTFSHQIALALEKAKLYKEVIDYSIELEDRVIERTKEIQRLQEEQTQMMLDISHKLQSPLTIIKGQIGLLRKKSELDSELGFFERTIDDISVFIYDLLHLARLETSQEILIKKKQDLSMHLLELIEYFEVITAHADIQLEHAIDPNVMFNYDRKKMTELVTNLVSNAVKYMGTHHEAHVKRKIVITLSIKESKINLTIQDNGIGISEEALPHIFERFYRARAPEKTAIGGTGLGLAICRKIVLMHNGTITVTSTKGAGTRFSILFPQSGI